MESLSFGYLGKKRVSSWAALSAGRQDSVGCGQAHAAFSFPGSSWLQRDVLCLLLLPVFWEQRVSHDCSALPFWGGQHCILERAGRVDC